MPSLDAFICPETPCHAASAMMMLRIWKPCFFDSARRSSHSGSYSSYPTSAPSPKGPINTPVSPYRSRNLDTCFTTAPMNA